MRYSNSGYIVLGHLIERASGQSYESFLRDNIFTPLGMQNSGYDANATILASRASGYTPSPTGPVNAAFIETTLAFGAGKRWRDESGPFRAWEAVGFTNALPMVQMHITVQVQAPGTSAATFGADMYTVSHDYFRAIGMRVVAGRGFEEEDRRGAQPLYVVNRAFAKAYFQDEDPIGRRLALAQYIPAGEVVGVVDDVRHLGIDSEPQPVVFVDPEHTIGIIGVAEGGVYFAVRTRGNPSHVVPDIRAIVHDLDANLAVDNIATMAQIVSNSITTPRSYAVLLGSFAVSALVLAMSGLYGVQAYFVTQRRHEIGIRLALGALQARVLRQVLRQGLFLGGLGLAVGLGASVLLTRFLETMLFGVNTFDAVTYVVVCVIFLGVTIAASYFPARQAASIDPQSILRS